MRIDLKRRTTGSSKGVALIIVMLMVLAMAGIVGIFAYSMKVEIKLATNTSSSGELAWVGLSGVEVAKWILVEEQRVVGSQQCNSLKQFWAGGPGDSEGVEDPFEGISLKHVQIDEASYVALEIIDQERKLNINQADPLLLEAALNSAGAGAADANAIHAALLDWRDKDDLVSVGGGAETGYYEKLEPPYRAKNGPVDEIGELLKVRGVSPELFWGAPRQENRINNQFERVEAERNTGLADLFCALSNGQVNINTAPLAVLQVAFRGDTTMAKQVIQARSGPDGIEGTTDDEPARNPGEVARFLGPATGVGAQGRFTTVSSVFEVRIEAHYGRSVRRYSAIIQRRGGRDFQTLAFREI